MKNKSTLADEYGINKKTLLKHINTPELKDKLKETCYKDSNKVLTPKQVEIIKTYLGNPTK